VRILAAALLTIGVAAEAHAQSHIDPGSYRIVALRPVPLAEAVSQLEQICLVTGFDHDRFDAAIARGPWRFTKEQGAGTPAPDVRLAAQGSFNFQGPALQERDDFVPGQCNMETVVRPAEGGEAIAAALGAALTRVLGSLPPLYRFSRESCWRWKPSTSLVDRLCIIDRPGAVTGHLALSFQRWTASAELRAHLVPPGEAAE
jgi:hypothetical protein